MPVRGFLAKAFAAVLHLLPSWFRASYGQDMLQDFLRRSGEIGRTSGWAARVAFQVRAVLDVPLQALRLERRVVGSSGEVVDAGLARWLSLLANPWQGPDGLGSALRSLKSKWVLTAVAVLTIALGVGLTTTAFSIVYGVLLRPLPFPQSDRLVALDLTALNSEGGAPQFEALDLRDFRRMQSSFEGLDGYFRRRVSVADEDGSVQSLAAGFVTATALDRLGVKPHLGRTFVPGEDFSQDIRTVVLGFDLWRQRYGGAEEVLGTRIEVDGRRLEVIGVMPSGFEFPVGEQLWLPMDFDLPSDDRGSGRSFAVFGRLKQGVGTAEASAEARTIAGRIGAENPGMFPPLGARVNPLAQRFLPKGIAPLLGVMLAAVLGVLLIACANVANLLLAGALARGREVAIRRALGASRRRIAQRFLLETSLLSTLGCALGLGLTAVSMDVVERWLPDLSLPYWVDISLAPPALALAAVLIVVVALAAGVLPAWFAAGMDASGALSERTGSSASQVFSGVRSRLAIAQIALSCALLIGAGLLAKSLFQLRTFEMGFDAEGVMVSRIVIPKTEYPKAERRDAVFAQILERAAALPGVTGAALCRNAPGGGGTFSWEFEVRGQGTSPSAARADGLPISHDYFRVLGVEVLQGREFTPAESRFGAEPVLIVNRTLASRRLGSDPVGRQIRIGREEDSPWLTVVGVVEDTYIGSDSGGIAMAESPQEQIYISWGVAPYSGGTLLVASEREPRQLVGEIRSLLRDAGLKTPLYDASRLSDRIVDSTWAFGLFGTVFGVLGAVALLMSAVGLYGLMSFSAGQRRGEIGVRMALGASANRILTMVLGEASQRLLWGTGLGLILGALSAQGVRAALYGVAPVDAWVYLTVLTTVAAAGLAASLLPALRAARTDPARSLRR